MTSLNLKLMHQDYLYLCSVFFQNISLDDFKDDLYIHDYHVYKNFSPTEIRFMIFNPSLSLFLFNDMN